MTTAVALLQLSLEDPNWTLFRNIGIGLVVVLWLATAYWTFKDARRRISDPWLVGLATQRRQMRVNQLHHVGGRITCG